MIGTALPPAGSRIDGAVLIAATVRRFSDDFTLLAGISACLSLGSVAFLVGLPEPRARAASLR